MRTQTAWWAICGSVCALAVTGITLRAVSADNNSSVAVPSKPHWAAGTEFEVLDPPVQTHVAQGKIEVVEVFWYSCTHCYLLEPYILRWQKTKPPFIEFIRVPVTWTADRRADARLYYTLVTLKREDLHQAVFDSIHLHDHPLAAKDPKQTYALQLEFATLHGIKKADFARAYQSAEVEAALANAEKITRAYRIAGVPSMVVNGHYTTDIVRVGGDSNNLLALVNYLARRDSTGTQARAEGQ